ncbi:MAG: TetR/AcrR family transcriptional regulator [Lactobacillus sp.]|uniref:TetR/AcrR family transcriptional regulator n=1 Tax=Lactobacillus sp. TaxID=1591 RepID=UPI0023D1195F|nr:TetR/AcrR family transcriptional regulator [Lactobacillus sp.]MDE7049820.1 TetR/AcrR family transcriptional regulator [Lactobacillus sp.]
MDFRSINTRNRIFRGFIKVLEEKRFSECTTSDILNYAEISKKTFYNYYKNKQELLEDLENELLVGLWNALEEDRAKLQKIEINNSTEKIRTATKLAFNSTLEYCDAYREELVSLLSSNGDISFHNEIIKLANKEFDLRCPHLFSINPQTCTGSELSTYAVFKVIYVDAIKNALILWLTHYDDMTLRDIKALTALVQTSSPVELMQILAQRQN